MDDGHEPTRGELAGDSAALEPSQELAALSHALARHVRRRATLSRRTFEAVSRQAPASPAPPVRSTPPAPTAIPTQAQAPTPPTRPTTPTTVTRPPLPVRPPLPTRPELPSSDETPDMIQKKKSTTNAARTAEDVKEQARGARSLTALRERVAACEACTLCQTRTQTVFMDGTGSRGVMFVGEAPGADEDRTGVPFVGRSGQLLTDIITKGMGLPREEVVIANVLKCRPPDNREPTAAEKEICTPWLDRQIELLDPQVIIPLGRHAAMHVLGIQSPMGAMRQKVHDVGGRKIVPTFHPSYLLRSPGEKKECWKDIQLAMDILGLPTPKSAPKG